MEDSILNTIKKMLGLSADYTVFDTDIIVFINGAMLTLQQLCVGPKTGFVVTGASETWSDFNNWLWNPFNFESDNVESNPTIEGIKQYIYIRVKMAFDPPSNSFVMDAMKQQKEEFEWRLREQAEFYVGNEWSPGYWQKVAEEDEEKKKGIDDGVGPFNGLHTGDSESEGG